jgi:adenylate cyclase
MLVALAPLGAQLLGSGFNIWYNRVQIQPLLTEDQDRTFDLAIAVYNLAVYPLAVGLWGRAVYSLRGAYRSSLAGRAVGDKLIERARRRAINLPNWVSVIAALAWFSAIPALLVPLVSAGEPLDRRVLAHLPVSVTISGLIGSTHAFFAVELLSRKLLYPVLFQNARPANVAGAYPVSMTGRALLGILATGVCPILSVLLLMLTEDPNSRHGPWFAVTVGIIGIVFGLSIAYMLARDLATPISELRRVASEIAAGNLDARTGHQRADELGRLIDEFNHMTSELREKQRILETFGRHVGQRAAREILDRNPGLGGEQREITVVFVDLRNFTATCSDCPPEEVVGFLNRFFAEMVTTVEQHGGMVNKFLGDGFMAIFGAAESGGDHAVRAVTAGLGMVERLASLNAETARTHGRELAIGVGIHTGPAVVGSIGCPQRMEYTAIGDTVNVASRVEALTKAVGMPLLVTEATCQQLPARDFAVQPLPMQRVKGKADPLLVLAVQAAE